MERENTIPIQWNQIIIRSIHKKFPKEDLANQRGIFLTNIVSKVYEKVKLLQNEENISNMSRMQCAGRKDRSPLDHIITLNAIIEKQRSEKKPTYILFADAEKCFDKLLLEDGLLELHKLGWSEKDVMMLFRLSHIANITVKTPMGDAEDFTIMNIVKQGTTHGPIICCAETSEVNDSEEPVRYQYEQVEVGVPVFMDDIMAAGNHNHINKVIRSCRNMEETKKFTYGLKKTKYMIVKTGHVNNQEITEEVKVGKIERTMTQKYLGIIVNEKGDLEDHIKEKTKSATKILAQIMTICSQGRVGSESVRVQLELYDKCAYSSIFYGIHAWGRIKREEEKELEKLQSDMLKRILNLPLSTPYTGILMETGIWPVMARINYASLMLFHSVINCSNRLATAARKEQLT